MENVVIRIVKIIFNPGKRLFMRLPLATVKFYTEVALKKDKFVEIQIFSMILNQQ